LKNIIIISDGILGHVNQFKGLAVPVAKLKNKLIERIHW
tara:strand:+ start:670 stop:786 length:117 start_codon:yes stop_codon:yes gene_type:complete